MADRKVIVKVVSYITIRMDEGIEVSEVIQEMDYNFTSTTEGADIEDSRIEEHNIEDSK